MEREKGKSIIEVLDDYTVIDIETTGLTLGYDEIIEIGAIKVRSGVEMNRFSSLIQPKDFSLFDSYFTGITVKELKQAPTIEEVIPKFLDFIQDDILVGANINSFDINFLYDNILAITNKKIKNNVVDIFRFARKLLPNLGKYSLENISTSLGFIGNHHRAIADCELTLKCYEWFKQKIKNENINVSELFKYKNPTYKVSDLQCTVNYIAEDNLLFEKVVVITGVLTGITRKEAQQLVKNMGGIPKQGFVSTTNFLVVGDTKGEDTEKIKKAQAARLNGQDVRIIDGKSFLDYCKEYSERIKGVTND